MAKKYIITEQQYKTVLEHLNINETEMTEAMGDMMPQQTDTPGYALISITPGETEVDQVLEFSWKESGSNRIYTSTMEVGEMQVMGFDPNQIMAQFNATKEIPEALEDAAFTNASVVDDDYGVEL